MSSDPRARTRTWINLWFDTDNTLKADGATPLQVHAAYANPVYQFKNTFFGTINNDVELAIQDPTVTPHKWKEVTYAYTETVPIEIYSVDKPSVVNGADAVWECEQELRRIAEVYPLGSIRTFQSMTPNSKYMGGWMLHSKKCMLSYKRAVETPATLPSITYGNAQQYTWIWPNALVEYPNAEILDVRFHPPGKLGGSIQNLGDNSLQVRVTSDLDVSPANLTFERPQNSTPKTDVFPFQLFLEMKHNSATQEYQNLTLSWGTFPVRLVDFTVEGNTLRTLFEEYNASSASSTFATRYGMS